MKKLLILRTTRGFIQIPILIAIFIGLLVVGGGTYEGVRVYKQNKAAKETENQVTPKVEDQPVSEQVVTERATSTKDTGTSTENNVILPHENAILPQKSAVIVDKPTVVIQPKSISVSIPAKPKEEPVVITPTPTPVSPAPIPAPLTLTISPPTILQAHDTNPPTTPTGLTGSAISSSAISLSWNTSSDNIAVSGYKIFRSGIEVADTPSNSFSDSSLLANTAYSYAVVAYDSSGNISPQSWTTSVTTKAAVVVVPPPPPPPPPTIKFVKVSTHDGETFTVESNKEIDFSKMQVIKGIFAADVQLGEGVACNSRMSTTSEATRLESERWCMSWNQKTEVLPISVVSIVKAENSPNGVPRCSAEFHVCDYPKYTIRISPNLDTFADNIYWPDQIYKSLYVKFYIFDTDGNSVKLPELSSESIFKERTATYGQ